METWHAFIDKLADKLMDAGNLTFGALIVGQLIRGGPFNWWLAVLGAFAWIGLYGAAYSVLLWERGE